MEEVEEALTDLFKNKQKPDAIFTTGDRITTASFASLKKMKQKKYDVGFTGFTNIQVSDLFSPPLTVIRQPAFEIGQTATELLIQIIESKLPVTDFERKVFETSLIIRDSSQKKI